MIDRIHLTAAIALAFPTLAFANCWGVGEQTAIIQRQQLRLESNNGPVMAAVTYSVTAKHEVCESGNVGLIDSRECASEPRGRRFFRSITLTTADGKVVNLGQLEKIVGNAGRIVKQGPCTDHAKALTIEGYAAGVGTATSWASEIAADKAETDRAISLIGRITETKVVFTM